VHPWGLRMRRRWLHVLLSFAVLAGATGAQAAEPARCARDDFYVAVDEAAAALRELNLKNRPAFQDRLRELKDKRGWSQDRFIVEAAPFVRDSEIEAFDARSDEALRKITEMGQEGGRAKTPDCRLLAELRGYMQALVEIQTAKWAYMFAKIEAAGGK